jgi:hypothetical protein
MGGRFASEKRAFGFCDRCGFRYDLNQRVCPECWEIDHPQNWVGIIGSRKAADDPQALRNPRPDTNLNASRGFFAFNPVDTQQVDFTLNDVFVKIT